MGIDVHPVTPERWDDLEALFGPRGACAGCWCMFLRQTRSEHQAMKGNPNRQALQAIVQSGQTPGMLAYVDGDAAGWCAVAPREEFSALERSRILKPVDDAPVWSITCLFVAKEHRRQGLTLALIDAALAHARTNGATVVEAYPVEPKSSDMPPVFIWTGVASMFAQCGFSEVARRSATRPIMRISLDR
ncbi:MAG TPA: GNAT family N-acetyltransferase [Thermomicrobiales bacterium]|nr:GNAT family N-acetyltransferase [Thermomicrobiales bacterium]